ISGTAGISPHSPVLAIPRRLPDSPSHYIHVSARGSHLYSRISRDCGPHLAAPANTITTAEHSSR
ncbi:Hypothetical predicted protein, partial [Pelobates cultripes]